MHCCVGPAKNANRVNAMQTIRDLMLGGENRLKLAIFGLNVSGGCTMISADGVLKAEWDESLRIARTCLIDHQSNGFYENVNSATK